jgi:hypothetical protein
LYHSQLELENSIQIPLAIPPGKDICRHQNECLVASWRDHVCSLYESSEVTFNCPFDNRYSFTFRKDIFSPGNVQLVDGKDSNRPVISLFNASSHPVRTQLSFLHDDFEIPIISPGDLDQGQLGGKIEVDYGGIFASHMQIWMPNEQKELAYDQQVRDGYNRTLWQDANVPPVVEPYVPEVLCMVRA